MKKTTLSFTLFILTVFICLGQDYPKNRKILFGNVSQPTTKVGSYYSPGFGIGISSNRSIGKMFSTGSEISMNGFIDKYDGGMRLFAFLVRPDLKFYFSENIYGSFAVGGALLAERGNFDFVLSTGIGAGAVLTKNKKLDLFVKYDFARPFGSSFQWISLGAGYSFANKKR